MTDEPAAISAVLRNYKPLVSRPYTQIILEIPAEQTPEVIKALGWPAQGESLWVGVARLNTTEEPHA